MIRCRFSLLVSSFFFFCWIIKSVYMCAHTHTHTCSNYMHMHTHTHNTKHNMTQHTHTKHHACMHALMHTRVYTHTHIHRVWSWCWTIIASSAEVCMVLASLKKQKIINTFMLLPPCEDCCVNNALDAIFVTFCWWPVMYPLHFVSCNTVWAGLWPV